MNTINIYFDGPFSYSNKINSLFEFKYKKSPGIYLWVIKSNMGNLIHYIGETSNFAKRHKEHLMNILSLYYGIFDLNNAKVGKQVLIWKGLWRDKSENPVEDLLINYSKLTSTVIDYINFLDIYFAEIDVDNGIRKHIEGSIGWNLRNKHQNYKVLYPDDNHIGMKIVKLNKKLLISSSEKIFGLDSEIVL